jgi:hypothetical protein
MHWALHTQTAVNKGKEEEWEWVSRGKGGRRVEERGGKGMDKKRGRRTEQW